MTNYKLTDEELKMLAEAERKMDSGEHKFVRDPSGHRLIVDAEVMRDLGLVNGQSVSRTLVTEIMERHLAKMQAQIALNNAMGKK